MSTHTTTSATSSTEVATNYSHFSDSQLVKIFSILKRYLDEESQSNLKEATKRLFSITFTEKTPSPTVPLESLFAHLFLTIQKAYEDLGLPTTYQDIKNLWGQFDFETKKSKLLYLGIKKKLSIKETQSLISDLKQHDPLTNLPDMLRHCEHLEELELDSSVMHADDFCALFTHGRPVVKSLKVLRIYNMPQIDSVKLGKVLETLVSLKELEIHGHRALEHAAFTEKLHLHKLTLVNCEMIQSDSLNVNFSTIRSLTLINLPHLSPGLLLKCFQQEKSIQIEELVVVNCGFCCKQIWASEAFSSFCTRAKHLKKLILPRTWNGTIEVDSSAFSSCEVLPKLEEISIQKWPSNCIGELVSKRAKTLSSVCLQGCAGLTETDFFKLSFLIHLTSLNLSQTTLHTEGIKAIAKKCKNLMALDFTRSQNLSDEVLTSFTFHPLKALSLRDCKQFSSQALLEFLQGNQMLEELYLDHCKQITDQDLSNIARFCPHLKLLSLANCTQIKGTEFIAIAEQCTLLQSINVSGCHSIKSDAFLPLIQKRENPLTHFIASGCSGLTDPVIEALSTCTKLHHVNISDAGNVSEDAILMLIEEARGLKYLNVSGLNLSIRFIMKYNRVFPSIETLVLDRCKKITDGCLEKLSFNLPLLNLSIQNIPGLTVGGIFSITLQNLNHLSISSFPNLYRDHFETFLLSHPNLVKVSGVFENTLSNAPKSEIYGGWLLVGHQEGTFPNPLMFCDPSESEISQEWVLVENDPPSSENGSNESNVLAQPFNAIVSTTSPITPPETDSDS